MEKSQNINIAGLLHDTCLEKVEFVNNNLQLSFFFNIEDVEYVVHFSSQNISDILCVEHFRDKSKQNLTLKELKGTSCVQIEKGKNKVNMILENYMEDTVIELEYNTTNNIISGNIDKLKEFWDIPAA